MISAIDRMRARQSENQQRLQAAIEQDGHFYWKGRKVLLTYEDTGKPTNEGATSSRSPSSAPHTT